MPPVPRAVRVALFLLVVVALLLVLRGLFVEPSADPAHPARVPLPPAQAGPEQVLTAYLQALGGGDDATAQALTYPGGGGVPDPCLTAIEEIDVPPMRVSPGPEEGQPDVAEAAAGRVSFRPAYAHSRLPWGCRNGAFTSWRDDEGTASLSFVLVRQRTGDPWRVRTWGNP